MTDTQQAERSRGVPRSSLSVVTCDRRFRQERNNPTDGADGKDDDDDDDDVDEAGDGVNLGMTADCEFRLTVCEMRCSLANHCVMSRYLNKTEKYSP
jgi:hypothetical protein